MSNKEKYRALCELEKKIPVFSQAWWLDSICGDAWDVCIVEKENKIIASMPYHIKRRYGFTLLSHPPLTQNLGPWLKPSQAKYCKVLAQQKDLMTTLIEQLPKHDYFNQNWHYSNTNWLPFYWKRFEQTIRYTYEIDNLGDLDKVWTNLQSNIRYDVRKAQKQNLTVKTDLPIEDFLDLHRMTFTRQAKSLPYSEELVQGLVTLATERQQCMWFIGQDEKGQNHAGVLLVWDENSAHYLMGGGDPTLRKSGATSLCVWEAIKYASTVTKRFDFEGSMIEPIERFFRGFGAIQKPYFSVSKTNSKIIKGALCLQKLLKG